MTGASIMRRSLNTHNQSQVYTMAKVSPLKYFKICRSDLEISRDEDVRSQSVKSFSKTNSEYPDDSSGNVRIIEAHKVALRAFTNLMK
jgi:hypothetical protein